MAKKHYIGEQGENIAAHFLRNKGYTILARNYTNKRGKKVGEIDVVASIKGRIVFVEVKTRVYSDGKALFPEVNITRAKLRKLEKIAQIFLLETRQREVLYGFDAVTIVINESKQTAQVRHLQDIFY